MKRTRLTWFLVVAGCTWLLVVIAAMAAPVFDQARAQRAVKFFESLKHTKGRFYGQPFVLLPWQKQIVQDVYGTVDQRGVRTIKTVYIEVPKKNGKSGLAAAAGLFHTFADGERNGEVYGCAADRSQASIVFDVAVDMIDQLPALQKRTKLTPSQKLITDKVSGTFYKVISSEAYSKHGLNVSAVIFDELHAQPNRDLWDVMTFGAGDARLQPIWWVTTTAGDDPDRMSVGWEQHEYAMKLLAGEIHDPTWYPVVFGYQPPEKEEPGAIYDEELWKQVNPSLGQTILIEAVREAAEKAKQSPADERLFRWLRLNQWITTKLTTWLPVDLFDQTVGEWNRMDLLGRDCYMGLDLSTTTDLSSLALVFPPQGTQLDWRVIWEHWIPKDGMEERIKRDRVRYDVWAEQGWITPTEGDVVDYNIIEQKILELASRYNVIELDADRAFATMLLQRLENAGITCVDVPQTYLSMTDPINQTEILLKGKSGELTVEGDQAGPFDSQDGESQADIEGDQLSEDGRGGENQVQPVTGGKMLTGKLTHEADLVARWAFGNASIAKNGSGLVKLVKEHKGKYVDRTKRIDPVVALVNAMARARFYTGSVDLSAAILDDDWGM